MRIIHLLFLVFLQSTSALHCPEKYKLWYGGSCIRFITDPRTFQDARKDCAADGAFLPSARNKQLQQAVHATLTAGCSSCSAWWLGLVMVDYMDSTKFFWLDGSADDFDADRQTPLPEDGAFIDNTELAFAAVFRNGSWMASRGEKKHNYACVWRNRRADPCQGNEMTRVPSTDLCVGISDRAVTWDEARQLCQDKNVSLAYLPDESLTFFFDAIAGVAGVKDALHIGLYVPDDVPVEKASEKARWMGVPASPGTPSVPLDARFGRGTLRVLENGYGDGGEFHSVAQKRDKFRFGFTSFLSTKRPFNSDVMVGAGTVPNMKEHPDWQHSRGVPLFKELNLIAKTEDEVVTLLVHNIELDERFEYLEVFDGFMRTTLLKNITGYHDQEEALMVTSTRNSLLLVLGPYDGDTRSWNLEFRSHKPALAAKSP